LYKPLPEVIRALSDGGVRVAALTNGANLKGDVANVFAEHGTWVRVSMDAWDEESYMKIRGARSGDFTQLLDNMRQFALRDTSCVLGVSFIVTHENYTHLSEVISLLRSAGVNHVKVSGAVVSNTVAGNNQYHAVIKNAVAKEIALSDKYVDSSFSVINHYHDLDARFEKKYHTCPFIMFNPVVGADQQVYTCHDKAYTESGRMGSLENRTFTELWFSEKNRSFLHTFDPSLHCLHHCMAHTKNLAVHEFLGLDQEHSFFV